MKHVNPWILMTIGLVCILLGNTFDLTALKINIDELTVNIGALMAVIATVQLFIDHSVHRKLINDAVKHAVGVKGAVDLGVESALINSKDIYADDRWKSSKRFRKPAGNNRTTPNQ